MTKNEKTVEQSKSGPVESEKTVQILINSTLYVGMVFRFVFGLFTGDILAASIDERLLFLVARYFAVQLWRCCCFGAGLYCARLANKLIG